MTPDGDTEELRRYRFVVRQYDRSAGGGAADKTSAAGPLVWRPLVLAGTDGRAALSFELPKRAGRFRVLIDAHGDGRLGLCEMKIETKGN